MKRATWILLVLFLAFPAMAANGKFDFFFTAKSSSNNDVVIASGSTVTVYPRGSECNADQTLDTTIEVWDLANFTATDTVSIGGFTFTVDAVTTALELDGAASCAKGESVINTTTTSSLFEDKLGSSALTQPLTASDDGRVQFYAPDGSYDIEVVSATANFNTYVMGDVLVQSLSVSSGNFLAVDGSNEMTGVLTLDETGLELASGTDLPMGGITMSALSGLNGEFFVDGVTFALTRAGIQAAIDAAEAAGGGIVTIPPGTFTFTDMTGAFDVLVINSPNVHLRGHGPTTILTVGANLNYDTIILVDTGADNTTISDMTIDGNGTAQVAKAGRGITVDSITELELYNLTIEDLGVIGGYFAGDAISITATTYARVHDLRLRDVGGTGVAFLGANNHQYITAITCDDVSERCIDLNATVHANVSDIICDRTNSALAGGDSGSCVAIRNSAQYVTVTQVTADGNRGGNNPSDDLFLVLDSSNVILSSLTMVDAGAFGVVINGGAGTARHISLSNSTVTGSAKSGVIIGDIGTTEDVTVTNSQSYDNNRTAIESGAGFRITNNLAGTTQRITISNCIAYDSGVADSRLQEHGLYVDVRTAGAMTALTVMGNLFVSHNEDGIYMVAVNVILQGVVIANNHLFDNGNAGVFLDGTASLLVETFSGNVIRNNGANAAPARESGVFTSSNSTLFMIAGNTIRNHAGYAFQLGTWSGTFLDTNSNHMNANVLGGTNRNNLVNGTLSAHVLTSLNGAKGVITMDDPIADNFVYDIDQDQYGEGDVVFVLCTSPPGDPTNYVFCDEDTVTAGCPAGEGKFRLTAAEESCQGNETFSFIKFNGVWIQRGSNSNSIPG